MQKVKGSQVNTFSIGFTDNDFNEAPYARQISDVLGTNHTELYLSDKDVEGLITDVPGIVDEPFADSSLLPTYAVSRLARQSVTVSLSGDGGDELFGGYTRYPTTAQAIRAKNRMGLAGKLFSSAMINSRLAGLDYTGRPVWPLGLNQHAVMRKLATALYALNQPDDASVYRGQVSFWRDPRTPVLGPGQAKCKFQNPQCWVDAEDVQESIQMMDIQTFLPDDILCKVDRAAMSVSLETRVPMLDHRFMEFVWSLPLSYRSSGRTQSAVQKKILKDIVARSVPAALMDRPKKGFGVPIGKWIRGPLRDWSESLLDVNTLKSQGLLDPAIVGTCWGVTKNNSDADAEFIWSILVLQQWLSQEKIST
jgi:asparagine synthase (glutamine-hydrolysing)